MALIPAWFLARALPVGLHVVVRAGLVLSLYGAGYLGLSLRAGAPAARRVLRRLYPWGRNRGEGGG